MVRAGVFHGGADESAPVSCTLIGWRNFGVYEIEERWPSLKREHRHSATRRNFKAVLLLIENSLLSHP